MKFLSILAALAITTKAQIQLPGAPFKSPVTFATGYTGRVLFSNATAPRGIAFDSKQNLLIVERGLGVTVLSPNLASVSGSWERTVIIKNANLTHGIQIDGSKLYVSTATEVLVYGYNASTKSVSTVAPYPVISGLPGDGELLTHTLQLETDGTGKVIGMLVGSGPLTNIDETARDPASGRSQIRRFVWPTITLPVYPPIPLSWANGQVIAYGIRNPGGFAFPTGPSVTPVNLKTLFVVENGASINNVTGLTPAFANDNPADELELVNYSTLQATTTPPKSYGFPDCTTLWNPTADPIGVPQYVKLSRGDQFSLHLNTVRDDAWCRNTSNNQPPTLSFQAHSVPLDIKFYTSPITPVVTSLPDTLANDAFVSFHGSFDRTPPTGYGVVHVPFPPAVSSTALGYSFIAQATNLSTCPGNCIRPVGLVFGNDGRLYVSSDSSGELFVIERAAV